MIFRVSKSARLRCAPWVSEDRGLVTVAGGSTAHLGAGDDVGVVSVKPFRL
jgi:hypothetical protein